MEKTLEFDHAERMEEERLRRIAEEEEALRIEKRKSKLGRDSLVLGTGSKRGSKIMIMSEEDRAIEKQLIQIQDDKDEDEEKKIEESEIVAVPVSEKMQEEIKEEVKEAKEEKKVKKKKKPKKKDFISRNRVVKKKK